MKTIDHLLLGRYLAAYCGTPRLLRHPRAFLLGCIEPDCNVLSYLRGMKFQRFRGHNAENTFRFLSRCAADFDENGIFSARDYFRFGVMLHYVADAFTAPHNRFWTGSLVEHVAYEEKLHRRFKALLEAAQPDRLPYREYVPLHQAYCKEIPGMENDFRYILTACLSLTEKYLLPSRTALAGRRLNAARGPAA